jgi:trimethylamine--corrinoid protein Co-methyltransferase
VTTKNYLDVEELEVYKKLCCLQLLPDCEIIKMIKDITAGIHVTDERMALDLIKELGPQGDYTPTAHTLKFFR